MEPKRLLIVGCGKRVRETALPALARAQHLFAIDGVLARSGRTLEAAGRRYDVEPLDELSSERLRAADLVYVAVGKDAVPAVLRALVAHGPREQELLLDTPVVRFKHFCHTRLLGAFRAASVAEDCVELPWLDAARAALADGALGALRHVVFYQAAYAYHGLATAKRLVGSGRVRSARRRAWNGRFGERAVRFANGTGATFVEPRDYASGRLLLVAERGSLSDYGQSLDGDEHLAPIVEDGACRGFRAGAAETRLDDDEVALMGAVPADATVTSCMEAMKRVGFLRLLRALHAGRGAYPVADALDDMVVDYHLEKLGRYAANPFSSARSPLARGLLAAATRAFGRS